RVPGSIDDRMRWSLVVTTTARVRRPFVASTSLLLPFAASMSRFTGSESRVTMATMCSATTTLPYPTLTSRVAVPFVTALAASHSASRRPPRPSWEGPPLRAPPTRHFGLSFEILDLLAHLLEDTFGGDRGL